MSKPRFRKLNNLLNSSSFSSQDGSLSWVQSQCVNHHFLLLDSGHKVKDPRPKLSESCAAEDQQDRGFKKEVQHLDVTVN